MSLDTDFQAELASLTAAPVQENYASENQVQPFVVWHRQQETVDLLLDGSLGLVTTIYGVDVYGIDPDATATVASALKNGLNGFRGMMGSSKIFGMFVEDASDEYIQKLMDADLGFHVFSFVAILQS